MISREVFLNVCFWLQVYYPYVPTQPLHRTLICPWS